MNIDYLLESWKEKEAELKKKEPKCTCEGGRKHPDNCYHYAECPYLQFWHTHFSQHLDSGCKAKITLDDFT